MSYDAGNALHTQANRLLSNDESVQQQLPLISSVLLRRLSTRRVPSGYSLALAAPELLQSLFSIDQQHEAENNALIDSVRRNPHEFRFAANFKRTHNGRDIEAMKRAAINVLPAVRNILPTDTGKLIGHVARIHQFLQPTSVAASAPRPERTPKPGIGRRFLAAMRRRRPITT